MARKSKDGQDVHKTITREYRVPCPRCNRTDGTIYKTARNERLGRTDRWRQCSCGCRHRSYELDFSQPVPKK